MAKTESQLRAIIKAFIGRLSQDMDVEKVFLWGDYVSGKPAEHSDVRLVVISEAFAGLDAGQRSIALTSTVMDSNPLIMAWGYTPKELSDTRSGKGGEPLLGMMLYESREVFEDAPAGPGISR